MRLSVNMVRKAVKGTLGWLMHGYPLRFDYGKKELIDLVFTDHVSRPASFADLGGIWGVDGAYTFYILKNYPVRRAVLVDTDVTAGTTRKQKRVEVLELIQGDFGKLAIAEHIGHVDAVVFFDVLLHQVSPDWNEVLEMYASRTECIVIYNQQFVVAEKTVRLPDLGKDEYFRHVPMDPAGRGYKDLFERPGMIHPRYNKPYRDVHNVWQWGITDGDLVSCMEGLGFRPVFQKNHGQFSSSPSFENHAFIFTKALS